MVHRKKTFWLQLLRKPVLQGWRDANGLWKLSHVERIPIPAKKRASRRWWQMSTAYPQYRRQSGISCSRRFPPTKDPWINAIKHGNYLTFPGITAKAVNKHFPESVETQKGHIEKTTSECKIRKAEANSGWANRGRWTYPSNFQGKYFCQSCHCTRDGILQPDRVASCAIQPRKYFAHGVFWCRCKLHQCRAHAES